MFHHISKPQEESWEYSQPSHKRPPKINGNLKSKSWQEPFLSFYPGY